MPKKKNTVRDDGRIAVQVYIGRDEKNKRKYKTVYGYTQKEADEKALQVKLAIKKGIDVTSELDSFTKWAERWEKLKSTEVSVGQMGAYTSAAKYLKEAIGHLPIAKVKAIDIQEIINDLAANNPATKKPSSKRTLRGVKMTASQIFQMAIENRVLDFNPANAVKISANAPVEQRRALTQEEQNRILELFHDAKPAAMIMMYAGLRRGELIPLQWSDIDVFGKTITVNKAVEKINGQFTLKPYTKTEAGVRSISIPQRLANYLASLPKKGLFVCCRADGSMHTDSSWRSLWNSYMTDMNLKYGDFSFYEKERERKIKSKFDPEGVPMLIPHITPHMLRHTFATMLYFAGIDVLTARDQMGHSDIKTILDVYTHLDKIHKNKQMSKLDAFLGDASQMQVIKT